MTAIQFSRRDFLKNSGLALLGSGLAGCGFPIIGQESNDYDTTQIYQDKECKIDSLRLLKDMNNSQFYDIDEFLEIITSKIENENISALNIGESHLIKNQHIFAYETITAAMQSQKRFSYFFDEGILWKKPIGVYADGFLINNDLVSISGCTIDTAFGCANYQAFHPLKLGDINNFTKMIPSDEFFISYGGATHMTSLHKRYINSLEPYQRTRGFNSHKDPSICDILDACDKKSINITMKELDFVIEQSVTGFLKELPFESDHRKESEDFRRGLIDNLNRVDISKVYQLGNNDYFKITDTSRNHDFGDGLKKRLAVLDLFAAMIENQELSSVIKEYELKYFKGTLYSNPRIQKPAGMRKDMDFNGEIMLISPKGHLNIYFKDNDPIFYEYS